MHDLQGGLVARGTAAVERGTGFIARLVAARHRLTRDRASNARDGSILGRGGVETWTRAFGERRFSSAQFAGEGRAAQLLCERFGPLTFAMALVVDGGRLSLVPRRWSALGYSAAAVARPARRCLRVRRERTVLFPRRDPARAHGAHRSLRRLVGEPRAKRRLGARRLVELNQLPQVSSEDGHASRAPSASAVP